MRVIITTTIEDNTTPAEMAEIGLTETFTELLYKDAFEKLCESATCKNEGARYSVDVKIEDNTQEAEEVPSNE